MDAIDILQEHGLKKTTPRVAIINALQSSRHAMSEQEAKEFLGPLYDRITFYRSVQTLEEAGVIHRIVADNTVVKYALNHCAQGHRHQVDHVHFFCTKCDLLVCLNDVKTSSYLLPKGFVGDTCEVVIKGTCSKCNSQTLC
ncbi:MAG: transcriptional repressor [Breznakibacter sp.]